MCILRAMPEETLRNKAGAGTGPGGKQAERSKNNSRYYAGKISYMGVQVNCRDYEQAYIGRMKPEEGPEQIRERLGGKLPRTFHGHSISVSDVLVLNKGGVVTSYYVEKDGFTVIAGFI